MISLLIALLPALALFLSLAFGRYPGGETLIRAARSRHPARVVAEPRRPLHSFTTVCASGGDLVARSLAGRAPPGLVDA